MREAPKGVDVKKWDRCVAQVKAKGGAQDPYAVCTAAMEMDSDLGEECVNEAIAAGAHAALQRGPMKKKECRESNHFKIGELKEDESGRKYFPVTLIEEGLGNLRDKNFYTEQAIKSAPMAYEGKPVYYNHADAIEEQVNPNRSVKDLIGHYENVKAVQNKIGLWEAQARLYPIKGESRKDATELLAHSIVYKKKYPDKDFVGISINGNGEGESLPFTEGIRKYAPKPLSMTKLKQVEGEDINWITKLSDAFSADVVTLAGAGGKINTQEAKGRVMTFKEAMKKVLNALQIGDYKAAEAAAKDMVEKKDKEDEDEKKEAQEKQAEADVKHMMQAMKKARKEVGEKKEDEDESEYEKKMEASLKAMFMKKKEAKDDDGDADDKKKEAKKKEDEDEAKKKKEDEDEAKKKKEKKKKEEEALEDDPVAKKLKEMADSLAALQKTVEDFNKKTEESDEALKLAKKEAAEAKTVLSVKARAEMIDKKLSECGQPMRITKLWKPVLESCRTEKDMDSTITDLIESIRQANSEIFIENSNHGTVERAADKGGSNDDLFLKR